MRFFYYLFSYVCFMSLSISAQANVVVVTDQSHPVYNLPSKTRVIELDAPKKLHEELSSHLPDHPAEAELMARKRLNRIGLQFQHSMQIALQGTLDAWMLGVTKVPAIVVDGYVVYGEQDVNHALYLIQSYKEGTK